MVASLKITEKFELKLLKVDLVEIFLKIFLYNFSIILSEATPEVYRLRSITFAIVRQECRTSYLATIRAWVAWHPPISVAQPLKLDSRVCLLSNRHWDRRPSGLHKPS